MFHYNVPRITGTLHENQYTFFNHLAHFFLEWEMFHTNFIEKIETHISCAIPYFRKSFRLWGSVEKYCRTEQATDDNTAHAHCMLDN